MAGGPCGEGSCVRVDDVRFLLSGDCALLVSFGKEISLQVNRKVQMLEQEIEARPITGVVECAPTYNALTVYYRPEQVDINLLKKQLTDRIFTMRNVPEQKKIIKEIPVLYGTELGPDLSYCAKLEKIDEKELIRRHSDHGYYVYMLGFAPGHPYMARFKEAFSFKRREQPRVSIPARSVVVQQNLSDFIPFEQPCGWNIIGSTPLELYDERKENPFLLEAGDWVKHIPVTQKEYDLIRKDVSCGTYKVKMYRKKDEI